MQIKYRGSAISTTEALAKTLGTTPQFLEGVAADPLSYYSSFDLPKRSGGTRSISDPIKELKLLQRRIVKRIFCHISFPEYLFGSVKDEAKPRDFFRNAAFHRNAAEVVSFDIDSFFPSTKARYVNWVFKYLCCFPVAVADLLTKLTTLNGALPQGAPTSTYLANLIFYDNEHKTVKVLHSKGLLYSRLVDDITVSSTTPLRPEQKTFVYREIQRMLRDKELLISRRKYKITNTSVAGKKTIITGLVVENKKVKLPKERIKAIGKLVYDIEQRCAQERTVDTYHKSHSSTSGMVALYQRLEPKKAEVYRQILRRTLPQYDDVKVKKVCALCRRFLRYAAAHPGQRDQEGFIHKYYRYVQRLTIVKRTHRKKALQLEKQLVRYKPTRKLASFYE